MATVVLATAAVDAAAATAMPVNICASRSAANAAAACPTSIK